MSWVMGSSDRYVVKRNKRQMMEGVSAVRSKIIARNTVEYEKETGERIVRFHKTDIVRFLPQGSIQLNSGGWRTATTRERINDELRKMKYVLYQDKGEWYVRRRGRKRYFAARSKPIGFADGMILHPKGKATGQNSSVDVAERAVMRKKINTFSKLVRKGYNHPSPEDCEECYEEMRSGESCGIRHLLEHVEWGENVPSSLVWNALRWAGYKPEVYFAMGTIGAFGNEMRAVRRYVLTATGHSA